MRLLIFRCECGRSQAPNGGGRPSAPNLEPGAVATPTLNRTADPKHTFAPTCWDLGRIGPQRSGSAGAAQMALIAELKRRNVFRVGVAYAIVEARRSA